ncbi:MAG: hypothetical protein WD749_00505 [Phycisphaerales bacterium]
MPPAVASSADPAPARGHPPRGRARRTARPTLPRWLPAAFPLALLVFSTFFLLGRTGFWSDDYWHNLRNPVTGELPPLTWEGLTVNRGFFLRPLFYIVVPPITTLAWEAQGGWPAHLAMTLAHGLVVLLLWRLMLALHLERRAAAAAALLYMVFPASFEALFWVSALPTTLATALMLAVFLGFARHARADGLFRPGRYLAFLAVLPAAAFAVCCLNEQPAMGVLCLPLVYWAALPPRRAGEPREMSNTAHVLRAIIPTILCGLAVLLYAALVLAPDPDKPAGFRGGPGQFVTLAGLPVRIATFFDVLWRRLVLKNFAPGALALGVGELRAAGAVTLIWLSALAITGALWLRWWLSPRAAHPPRPRPAALHEARPNLRVFALAPALFLTGWIPILMMAVYDPDSRTRYWPAIGLALMIASIGTAIGSLTRRSEGASRAVNLAVGGALLAALALFSVMLIGVQSAFRSRWELDRLQGSQLRALMPDPQPLTFFVPLDIRSTGITTGAPVFDSHFRSVWEFPWTAPRFIMGAYGRDDVRAGYWRGWTPGRPVIGADESGIHFADRLGPRFPRIEGSGSRVPWDRALPFIIGPDAAVRLVTHIQIEGGPLIEVPQLRRPFERGQVPRVEARLPRG